MKRNSSDASRLLSILMPLAALAVSFVANDARAQSGSGSYFPTSTPIGVRDRARPDYAAFGLPLGGLELYPTLIVAPEYDDNIFATDHGRQSDLITAVSPSVILQSNWNRNSINASVGSTSNFYASHTSQDTTDYQLAASGRLDILTQSNASAGFTYAHSTEPRTAEDTVSVGLVPVQYDQLSANAGALQTLTRLRFTENVSAYRTSFTGTVNSPNSGQNPNFLNSGQNLNYLNNNMYEASGRADYAFTPEMSLFVSAQLNTRAYDQRPPAVALDRNSDGYETTVGSSFNITQLLKGQVQVGYLQQNYRSNIFHSVSGPAAHVNVEYYPSELTTVSVSLNRNVIDAEDPNAISFLQTQGTVQVDHEVLPNVIVSARAGYEQDLFKGVQREDRRPSASVTATYLLNRHLGVTGGYSFVSEDSTGIARIGHYAANVLSLSFTLQL